MTAPDPATNDAALLHPDALAAARIWATEHGHQQPDDRMLAAYGRVLAPLIVAAAVERIAIAQCVSARCGQDHDHRPGADHPLYLAVLASRSGVVGSDPTVADSNGDPT